MSERIILERFLDADQEPNQSLTPIKGYETYPLVSLKEAIEPVKQLLYDFDTMVAIAKRNCKKPKDGLTQDESASIHLYTMQWPHPHSSLFTLLNEKLRSKNRNVLTTWFLFLKLFFTALYKLPSMKRVIYRGVCGNLSDEYDEDHFWWGMSSCTETMNIMETFIGTDGDRTIFNIECLNGKSIQSHSYFQNENEILLLPGTYFQVVSKWKAAKGLFIIHLREKIPPYQTLTSPFDVALSSRKSLSNRQISSSKLMKIIFKQYAKIVAGGNGKGKRLNQLDCPEGIFIDENKHIYIADWRNDRIVEWKSNEKQGQIIAGGNGNGERIDQLNYPTDVIVDQQNYSIVIADRDNRRVIRWKEQKQEILIEDIDCWSLTMDTKGFLYVSDVEKHEVRRWKTGKEKEGTLVAGGNDEGDQLNYPSCIFVDDEQSIYVSDNTNHCVIKWRKKAREGIIVAGGNGYGKNPNQLSNPGGVIIDHFGQVYVADCDNHRVMRWCEGDREGEVVVGGNGQGNELNQLFCPRGLSFDNEGNLYVGDSGNHRILRFDLICE